MRQELRAGNRSMFSRALSSSMTRVLGAGQQAILYLNRRGAATFVMCRDCGQVETCPRCAVPLTYHDQERALSAITAEGATRFPQCARTVIATNSLFRQRHEKVEDAVRLEFPTARTLRWTEMSQAPKAPRCDPDRFIGPPGGCANRHANDRQRA